MPQPFEAILYPNPPLARGGFLLLAVAVCAVSSAMATLFAAMGAWPVSGFFGLDALALLVAFQISRRAARRHELVRVAPESGLLVRRVEPGGRSREWRFEPYWVRVELDRSHPGGPQLVLASHGRRLAIGQFLTPDERIAFAEVLRDVLARYRTMPAPA